MAKIPFIATLSVTLSANAQGSVSYQNSANQTFEIHSIMQKSTAGFDVIDWSNNASQQYSNCSDSNPLDGDVFPDMASNTDSSKQLPIPLTLNAQEAVRFTFEDTSGSSNTVDIALIGIMDTGK